MAFFKPTALPLPTWTDYAPRLAAAGYMPLPIERQQIDNGHETPAGPWAFGVAEPNRPDAHTVGVLCGQLPRGSMGTDDCRATWIAAIRLDVHAHGRVARDVEAIVRSFAGESPMRECNDSKARLIPMRIEDDPRYFALKTGSYALPGDARFTAWNAVRIESAGACFLATGGRYRWEGDRDLTTVSRADLPLLTVDEGREMLQQCDEVLRAYRIPEAPTERQLRLEAARHRALAGVQ